MTKRQRMIDGLALRARLPFGTPVEQSWLQQRRCHACMTLRDLTGDGVFPLGCQSHCCTKRFGNHLRDTSMLAGDLSNLLP